MAVLREFESGNFAGETASGTVLVDFGAPWCSYCRVLNKVLEQTAPEAPESAVILKVNVDEFPELAAEYSVTTLPTLILFKDGKPSEPKGMLSKTQLLEMLRS